MEQSILIYDNINCIEMLSVLRRFNNIILIHTLKKEVIIYILFSCSYLFTV